MISSWRVQFESKKLNYFRDKLPRKYQFWISFFQVDFTVIRTTMISCYHPGKPRPSGHECIHWNRINGPTSNNR